MDLKKGLQRELAREGRVIEKLGGVQEGHDQQRRVGARRARLIKLALVDHEIFEQDRKLNAIPHPREVLDGPAEAGRLGQDRDRGRSSLLVGHRDRGRLVLLSKNAGAGRRTLHLGDRPDAALVAAAERLTEGPDVGASHFLLHLVTKPAAFFCVEYDARLIRHSTSP